MSSEMLTHSIQALDIAMNKGRWILLKGPLTKAERAEQIRIYELRGTNTVTVQGIPYERPRNPSVDCEPGGVNAERPCPWLSCRHHLGKEITSGGSLWLREGWDDGRPTCALDMAGNQGMSLEEVSIHFGLTRERIRQVEERALAKLRRGKLKTWKHTRG